jgi:manganese efflux pump family protein
MGDNCRRGLAATEISMSAAAIVVLAFSMSMDAFAASLGKAAALRRPAVMDAFRTGMIFGLMEAATPVIGWIIGAAAAAWVGKVDHWIAFIMLGLIGARMIYNAAIGKADAPAPEQHSFGELFATAVATSLDAMVVGITLAFMNVDIVTAATAIGLMTFAMATIGTLAGRWIEPLFGRSAEVMGGLCLIGIGTKILFDHTLGV